MGNAETTLECHGFDPSHPSATSPSPPRHPAGDGRCVVTATSISMRTVVVDCLPRRAVVTQWREARAHLMNDAAAEAEIVSSVAPNNTPEPDEPRFSRLSLPSSPQSPAQSPGPVCHHARWRGPCLSRLKRGLAVDFRAVSCRLGLGNAPPATTPEREAHQHGEECGKVRWPRSWRGATAAAVTAWRS